jgi:hypothetical protein
MKTGNKDFKLPQAAIPLGLDLSYPDSCWKSLMLGREGQSQDDKWSVYGCEPWVQIYRGLREFGGYCFAVRFEMRSDKRFEVAESWGSQQIIEPFGIKRTHEIVTFVLDHVARHQRGEFRYRLLTGNRERGSVRFSGSVSTDADIDEVTQQLREQVGQLDSRGGPR